MNLENHYKKLYHESINKISSDNYHIDTLIDSKNDRRFGLTLIIRPSNEIKKKIQNFLKNFKEIEPNQYYYPNSDIHITVMSIISCYSDFDMSKIDVQKYIDLTEKCLLKGIDLNITFKGITASPSGVMVQGFMNNNELNDIRNRLRKEFKNSNVEQSLDKRYLIQTAHSTIIRFRKELSQKEKFLELLDNSINYDFGTFKVNKFELVYNDWYQREQYVKKIHEFVV
ncbi:mutarotase [Flavobacterium galactosidilyticum]|uniref:2'-5' RNA ligase family protein n=1 Tax=Flavobacterium galactosidilyticum TaxID=2893886 RepID=UPI001E4C3BA0|nr:mutarotase [Flavobacterium sp. F-340]UFH47265.1 mutarotase [Flavobacterium sp. F-340]